MKQQRKQAFTLVELIVVITILAILGTIAFISLQGYSLQSRDSARMSDLSTMRTTLELFQLDAGKYPIPTDGLEITYSGGTVWTQGYFGDSVFNNVTQLDKLPLDPLTSKKYVYSTTNTKQEFQLAGVMEGDEVTLNGNQVNAGEKTALLKIIGNYNGKVVKVSTGSIDYILGVPSLISATGVTDIALISSNNLFGYNGYKNLPVQYEGGRYNILGDSGVNLVNGNSLVVYSGSLSTLSSAEQGGIDARANLISNLQSAYTGTTLTNIGEIDEILNVTDVELLASTIVSNNLGGSIIASSGGGVTPTILGASDIDQTLCESANWMWVDSATDVYIGSSQGSGFCISPRVGEFGAGSGDGISWNGWGNDATSSLGGWDASSIDDSGNLNTLEGQTKRLDSESGYICKNLGTSSTDFDTTDNIVGRMKWLSTNKVNLTELQDIEWIQNATPSNSHPIPALYIADCIDGVKDLGVIMIYTHNNDSTDEVTYAEYNTDESSNTGNAALSNITYQNRQKYLTAWTQKTGSHLPSAFSYITSGFASASDVDGDNLTLNDRGEYQVACEANILIDSDDNTDDEYVWTSAIGHSSGSVWGSRARTLGHNGCGTQQNGGTGLRYESASARFVIRP